MPTINSDPHSGSRLQKLISDITGAFATLFKFRTRTLLVHVKNLSGRFKRCCPICSFDGYFHAFGSPLRWDAKCTQCGSLERHRQFWLWLTTSSIPKDSAILHFAPEAVISSRLRTQYSDYKTADLYADHVDLKINIEKIALPSNSVEVVICMHVLEHVNTEVALGELQRIVKPGGMALIMVPLVSGLPISYRNADVTSRSGRELYFGQFDHSVLLGDDFQSMITNAGFNIEKHVADIDSCVKHSLTPGEILFICRKP